MGDWGLLSKPLDKAHPHSTNTGKARPTAPPILRIMVLGGVDKVWGDEQSNTARNVITPGCKNVRYDNKFPISHSRLRVLQTILVTVPTPVHLGHALHAIHKEDKLRQKAAEKRGTKRPKYTDVNGKLLYKGNLLCIYVSCLVTTILFEAGFIVLQYYLYGFLMEPRVTCDKDPCPHPIECFTSRPTEKTVPILSMPVVACASLLLNIAETFHLICRAFIRKKPQEKYVTKETHC